MAIFDALIAVFAVFAGVVVLLRDFHSREAFVGGVFIVCGLIYLLGLLRARKRAL